MSLQVNFPDHTKLVLSSDAGYCRLICLSVEASEYLKEHGDLPWKHIKSREILHGSLQQLLYGSADKTDPVPVKEITEGNALREKLEFLLSVVEGWLEGGGLGRLANLHDYTWKGQQLDEKDKKLDWASVGRRGSEAF